MSPFIYATAGIQEQVTVKSEITAWRCVALHSTASTIDLCAVPSPSVCLSVVDDGVLNLNLQKNLFCILLLFFLFSFLIAF